MASVYEGFGGFAQTRGVDRYWGRRPESRETRLSRSFDGLFGDAWAEAAGVHEDLNELPEDRQTQDKAAEGPAEVEVFRGRAAEGTDAVHGCGVVTGIVAEAADGAGGQSFGIDEVEAERVAGGEPGAEFAAWAAGAGDVE